jgi:hypothetical protein
MTDPLDRYFDDFGRQLERPDVAPAGRSDRQPITVLAASTAACAVVVAAVVLLVAGGSSTHPVDAVAAARLAITPSAGEIVYLRITGRLEPIPNVTFSNGVGEAQTTEQWAAAKPSRWRLVQTIPRSHSSGSVRARGRALTGRQEFTYADGKQSVYYVERHEVVINEGFPPSGPASKPLGLLGGDPQRTLPGLLQAGKIRDLGIVHAHGRAVRRLQSQATRDGLRRTFTYDVDPSTFAPVGGEWRLTSVTHQRPKGRHTRTIAGAETFTVDQYKRIPLTPSTAGLLTVHPAPGTRVIRYAVKPSGRGRTRIATCVVRRDRSLACSPIKGH